MVTTLSIHVSLHFAEYLQKALKKEVNFKGYSVHVL